MKCHELLLHDVRSRALDHAIERLVESILFGEPHSSPEKRFDVTACFSESTRSTNKDPRFRNHLVVDLVYFKSSCKEWMFTGSLLPSELICFCFRNEAKHKCFLNEPRSIDRCEVEVFLLPVTHIRLEHFDHFPDEFVIVEIWVFLVSCKYARGLRMTCEDAVDRKSVV